MTSRNLQYLLCGGGCQRHTQKTGCSLSVAFTEGTMTTEDADVAQALPRGGGTRILRDARLAVV